MLRIIKLLPTMCCLRSHHPAMYQLQFVCRSDNWRKPQKRPTHAAMIHTSTPQHQKGARKSLNGNQPLFTSKSDLSRFLIEVGTDPKEARYWLKNFVASSESSDVFMVINLQNEVFESHSQLENFASTISFLYRNGINPLIIVGNQPERPWKATKDATIWNALKLSDMIEEHGTLTRVLYPGCGVVLGNEPQLGDLQGSLHLSVSTDLIVRSLQTKHLPILLSFGETVRGQMFVVPSWDLTVQVSRLFQPKKVMIVNTSGGFHDSAGKVIANVNLPSDLALAQQKAWCTPEIVDTMMKVNKLLIDLPADSSVVITSSDTLLRELFSHRGSGTFFRATEAIHKYTCLRGIDLDRLRVLLNRSFMCEISNTYFEDIKESIHAIYLSQSYSGVAIVLKCEEQEVPYLCKFAVTNKAQGQGTGELLWDTLTQQESSLFWRSKTVNPINTWYFKKCGGSWHNPLWTVFWYGVSDPSKSSGLIQNAVGRKDTFKRGGEIGNIVSDDEEERIGG